MDRYTFHWTRLSKSPSKLPLISSGSVASPACLGNLNQCFTTLTVKNIFLIFYVNQPLLFTHFLSPAHPDNNVFFTFPVGPFRCWKVAIKTLWSFLQTAQLQLLPVSIGVVLSDHLCGPLLTNSNSLMSFLFWEPQNWIQYCKWESRGKSKNHLPWFPGHTSFRAAQDMVWLFGLQVQVLASVEFSSANTTKLSSSGLLSVHSPLCLVLGNASTGVGFSTSSCWTSWILHGRTSRFLWMASLPFSVSIIPHFSVSYTNSHCPFYWQKWCVE